MSDDFARRHGIAPRVYIAAQAMTTDTPSTFEAHDMMQMVGYDMAKAAREQGLRAAGIGPEDVDVVELHDCFTQNELITYEALGLCAEGEAEKFIEDGDNTYGGKCRHQPVGRPAVEGPPARRDRARAVPELVRQLRGTAEERQVEGAKVALAAQPRPRRRVRRDAVPRRVKRWSTLAASAASSHPTPWRRGARLDPAFRRRDRRIAAAEYVDDVADRDAGHPGLLDSADVTPPAS